MSKSTLKCYYVRGTYFIKSYITINCKFAEYTVSHWVMIDMISMLQLILTHHMGPRMYFLFFFFLNLLPTESLVHVQWKDVSGECDTSCVEPSSTVWGWRSRSGCNGKPGPLVAQLTLTICCRSPTRDKLYRADPQSPSLMLFFRMWKGMWNVQWTSAKFSTLCVKRKLSLLQSDTH